MSRSHHAAVICLVLFSWLPTIARADEDSDRQAKLGRARSDFNDWNGKIKELRRFYTEDIQKIREV